MVLEDLDLTIVWPPAVAAAAVLLPVAAPFSLGGTLPLVADDESEVTATGVIGVAAIPRA